MRSLHEISLDLARFLGSELGHDSRQVARLTFGLEVLLGMIIKSLVFLLVTLALGIFGLALAVFLVTATFRSLSGGAHCRAYHRCLISSMALTVALAYLARLCASLLPGPLPVLAFTAAAGSLAFLAAWRWAPDPDPNAPLESEAKRRRMRALTLGAIVLWAIGAAGVALTRPAAGIYLWAGNWALLLQFLTITPAGHRLVYGLDAFLARTLQRR